MTLDVWLKNLSTQLGDFQEDDSSQQFVHWPKDLLLSYYNDAVGVIASLKPQDYTTTQIVRLLPGSTQTTCCTRIGPVTEFVDKYGRFISRIRASKKASTWLGTDACADGCYKPDGTYKLDEALNSFEISPPVPETGEYYVKVRCSGAPPALTEADLANPVPPSKYSAAITEWALYRAFSGETDLALLNMAQLHYKVFSDLLGLQMKAETAFLKAQA